jgi:PadR family transcriptional regulator PadR
LSTIVRFTWLCSGSKTKSGSAPSGRERKQPPSAVHSLTSKGRAQLVEKTSEWQRLTRAMELILDNSMGPSSKEA